MDNVNKPQFCNSEFDCGNLYGIINSFYPIGVDNIELIYNLFISSFKDKMQDDVYERETIRDISEVEKIKQKFYVSDDAKYIGIDFPSWINFDPHDENRKRIMVVGIDPLRSEESKKEKIEIGTPYGFHDEKIKKKMQRYWCFISQLSINHSIYLTDTFKLFYYRGDNRADLLRSYKYRDFTHPHEIKGTKYNDIHQAIFKEEVDLVKPDLIITLGHMPRIWFSEEKKGIAFREIKDRVKSNQAQFKYYNVPILPLPHLSGRSINDANFFIGADTLNELSELYSDYATKYLIRLEK